MKYPFPVGRDLDDWYLDALLPNPFYTQHGAYPVAVEETHPKLPKRRRDVWRNDKTIFEHYLPKVRTHEAGFVWQNARRHHYLIPKVENTVGVLLKRLYVDGIVLRCTLNQLEREAAEAPAEPAKGPSDKGLNVGRFSLARFFSPTVTP